MYTKKYDDGTVTKCLIPSRLILPHDLSCELSPHGEGQYMVKFFINNKPVSASKAWDMVFIPDTFSYYVSAELLEQKLKEIVAKPQEYEKKWKA